MYPPFSTPDAWGAYAANSKANSIAPSPIVGARTSDNSPTTSGSTPSTSSATLDNTMSRPNTDASNKEDGSSPLEKTNTSPSFKRTLTQGSRPQIQSHASTMKPKKRKKQDRWWRVSDDKIKEAKTSEVLGMQREVYLLFYELERPETTSEE